MKSKFNKDWKSSIQPRKQRKFLANAPLHIRRRLLSANLSKPLRKKYNTRNIILRKGDEVKVMRGSFKGKKGKVSLVDTKKVRLQIGGLQKEKGNEKVTTWFKPSNVQIISLDESDAKRFRRLKKTESAEKQGGKEQNAPKKN